MHPRTPSPDTALHRGRWASSCGPGQRRAEMKVDAAVIRDLNEPWSVEEVDLDGPSDGEVLVHVRSTGLGRTSDHLPPAVVPFPYPAVGGHEAAGVVEEVGSGVTGLEAGDHVVLLWEPGCGRCRGGGAGSHTPAP